LHARPAQKNPAGILSAHFGRYRDFGLYADSLAFYGSRMFYYVWDVPIFCLMGAVGGLMGALWVHVNVRVTAFRHRCIPVRRARACRPPLLLRPARDSAQRSSTRKECCIGLKGTRHWWGSHDCPVSHCC
jgi:hypothetical protein